MQLQVKSVRGADAWIVLGKSLPIYQPWAKKMRRPNMEKTTPVPIHRYVLYGVDLSRYDW